jgi:hypothetical protein
MPRRIEQEVVLNDDCTAVTITLHDIPIAWVAETLASLGHPSIITQMVDAIDAQIPIKQAGGGPTRRVLKVQDHAE